MLDTECWILDCIQPRRGDIFLTRKDTFIKNPVGVTEKNKEQKISNKKGWKLAIIQLLFLQMDVFVNSWLKQFPSLWD